MDRVTTSRVSPVGGIPPSYAEFVDQGIDCVLMPRDWLSTSVPDA